MALVVSIKTGNILASTTNSCLPVRKYKFNSIHAEQALIEIVKHKIIQKQIDSNELRKGLEIISLRFDKNGQLKNGKPCLVCGDCIKRNHFLYRKITYSTDESELCTVKTDDFFTNHVSQGDIVRKSK